MALKVFTFLLLLLLSLLSFSQINNKQILIYGKITDNDSLKPLKYVTIADSLSGVFTITDEKGYYKLIIPNKNSFIKISSIGYKSIIKPFIAKKYQRILELNIALKKSLIQLPIVNINSENVIPVYNKKEDWVLDFDFIGDSLLLLLKEKGQKFIKILDLNDSVLFIGKLFIDVDKFYKDCFGNIHLLNNDSVYQIYFADENLYFIKAVLLKDFKQQLRPCITIADDNLFFYNYYNYNQSLLYYLINKNTKKKKSLYKITNEESADYNEMFKRQIKQFREENFKSDEDASGMGEYASGMGENTSGMGKNANGMGEDDSGMQQEIQGLENSRILKQMNWFFYRILTKPIYSPLFKIRDSIFIFDNINKQVKIFNNKGEKIRQLPVTYVDNNQWANELIVNNEKNAVYAKYLNDGMVKLININLNTGIAEGEITISKLFPSKIKIYKNYVYYLYKDEYSEGENKFLFKQKIE